MRVWADHRSKSDSGMYRNYFKMLQGDIKGPLARNTEFITKKVAEDPIRTFYIVAYGNIYDVSAYMDAVTTPTFLGPNILKIIQNMGKQGKDATAFMEQIKSLEGKAQHSRYLNCMNNLFFDGVIDHRHDPQCIITNYTLLASSIFLILIISIKFFAALQYESDTVPETQDAYTIVCIPCYNEGAESLRTCIHSIAESIYAPDRLLLIVVVDGVVVGAGNDRPTSAIVADLLGIDPGEPLYRMYWSLGDGSMQLNMAMVYSGYLAGTMQRLPYIVIVKVGDGKEVNKPGNRGKRDSQMILMQFLSRVYMNQNMNPLELELNFHVTQLLGVDPKLYEYVLWIDGDTEVFPTAISSLVSHMSRDTQVSLSSLRLPDSVAKLCYETKINHGSR